MSDLNKVILIGRLTRDADLKYTANGMAVSKFSLAINEKKKSGDEWVDDVNYVDITLFGKQAESLDQYLTKGKQIAVDGKLKQERWTDRDSGQGRSKISVIANNIQLLSSGRESHSGSSWDNDGDSYGSGGYSGGGFNGTSAHEDVQPKSTPASKPAAPAQPYKPPISDDGFADDIPF